MGANFTISQPSFAAGEISPSLRARTDLAKYRVAAALMQDVFALPTGGAASRQGTKAVLRALVTPATHADAIVRLVPFVYGVTQTYMLEFSYNGTDGYMRVIKDGGYVLETAQSVTSITAGATTTINKVAHGYVVGDWIWFSSVLGSIELNSSPGFAGVISSKTNDTFVIKTIDNASIVSSAWGAFISGTMARVYRTDLPANADNSIADLRFSQNADTMTITNVTQAGGEPYNLTRASDTSWTFTAITFAATVQVPSGGAPDLTRTNVGTLIYTYVVTAVYDITGEESLPTARAASNAAGTLSAVLNQDTGVSMLIEWGVPASGPTPDRYNIYKGRPIVSAGSIGMPTIFGYCGQSTALDFRDTNIEPDFTRGPPKGYNPFTDYGDPITSTYFGGRQWYGGTLNYPNVLIGSQVANYKNMDYHLPIRADDSITVALLSNQVNPIKHLLSLNTLIALTGNGAWTITGDGPDEAITALSIRVRPQIYDGCSDVPPLNVSSDILYLSQASTRMRTLAYDFTTNLFTGVDITLLASHLFNTLPITALAYAEEPYSLVYAVRDDGAMNVMTYLKEQDVYAWTHYATPGNGGTDVGVDSYIDVATVKEGNEDVAYFTVERTVPGVNGGLPFWIIERQATRLWYDEGAVDADQVWCLDSAVRTTGSDFTTVRGLHHMIGGTALVYADGALQASQVVGTDGTITIERAADNVLVGFGYAPQMQTLRVDLGDGSSAQGKRKKVTRCTMILDESRGVTVAPMKNDINGDSIPGTYYPLKERTTAQTYNTALPFISGVRTMTLDPGWQVDGSLAVKGTPGLPFTLLAVIPTISIADDGG